MVFSPPTTRIQWESFIICCWIVIIDGLLLLWAIRRPIDWLKFALIFVVLATLPLLLHLAYRTWAALTLEYWVDRNAVTIRWANTRQIIPLHEIRRVVRGGLADLSEPRWGHWPANEIRQAHVLGLLNVRMLASRPLEQCLLLETKEGVFAISPAAEEAFLDALQARYQFGPSREVEMAQVHTSSLGEFFNKNPAGLLLLGIGLAGVLALIGLLMVRFPGLPDEMVMQVNREGLPLSIRSKNALFLLPAIGLLAWLINGFGGLWMAARRQSTGAFMLWGGTIVVQICSLLALISLMP
jgi:hypothetical protein